MAECLVVARKLNRREANANRGQFIAIENRPNGLVHASSVARRIADTDPLRQIEDGPFNGTPITIGSGLAGQMLTAPSKSPGEVWGAVRLSDFSLAQTAFALSSSKLWLPGSAEDSKLPTTCLGELCKTGLHHRDITGLAPRGPFDKVDASPTATYPALWNHNASKETRMVCDPDAQLLVRQGLENKAPIVWNTASHAHLNLDFRFNSQPLGAAYTVRVTMGGRAWPNAKFNDSNHDQGFVLWANSTLGLLCFWWHSNRQVAGRGTTAKTSAESLTVLDFRALSDEQLGKAEAIFEEFRDKEFKPAYLADADPNRALLDRRVVCDCWASTRRSTQGCGGWRPSGARSRRYTGVRRGRRVRSW